MLVASNKDGRIFFLLNKSPDFDDLELLGYVVMNDPVVSHAYDLIGATGTPIKKLSQRLQLHHGIL